MIHISESRDRSFILEDPAIMPILPSAHDDGSHPVQSLSGDVVCFGFLTYCLLLMVEHLPPNNGCARVLDSVDTVEDDATIVASILTKWRIPTSLRGQMLYHGIA